jgi:hypothetical protein
MSLNLKQIKLLFFLFFERERQKTCRSNILEGVELTGNYKKPKRLTRLEAVRGK